MKRSASILLALIAFYSFSLVTFGQQGCEFNIIGTWKVETNASTEYALYRFSADGTVTALSPAASTQAAETAELARAFYELDDPKMPKAIAFKGTKGSKAFPYGTNPMEIVKYDDTSFTCVMPRVGQTRWIRVDPYRYFIVLAARTGEFYDRSGPAFPMLIKLVGKESVVDAFGTYSKAGTRAFGTVPSQAYADFLKEPQQDSEVMLRLEINSAQYERGLNILRSWERRVREGALLYPARSPLNNILLVKAVAETLNQCSDEIKIYQLNYLHPEDWITTQYGSPLVPFNYFKELRRLNESLHVRDDKFKQALLAGTAKDY
jgi:hypothetical protein